MGVSARRWLCSITGRKITAQASDDGNIIRKASVNTNTCITPPLTHDPAPGPAPETTLFKSLKMKMRVVDSCDASLLQTSAWILLRSGSSSDLISGMLRPRPLAPSAPPPNQEVGSSQVTRSSFKARKRALPTPKAADFTPRTARKLPNPPAG